MNKNKIVRLGRSQNAHSLITSMLKIPEGGKTIILKNGTKKFAVKVTAESKPRK